MNDINEEQLALITKESPLAETDETLIPEVHTESGTVNPPAERKIKKERKRLVAALACTVLAALSVIVYGTTAVKNITRVKSPLSEILLGEVLGVGAALQGSIYAPPPLGKIPPQTVTDGVPPGAAENETAPDEPDTPTPEIPPNGNFPIVNMDLSVTDDPFAIINETPYEPDAYGLFSADSPIPDLDDLQASYGKDAPVVLIIHTHGTESYSPHGASGYSEGESFRSLTPEDGVVAVGREMKKVFESHGIGVIHLETMFDAEDFNSAYYLAAQEIIRITKEYPSISYVFDVHRDAMVTPDGTGLRPTSPSTTTVDGVSAAQIMLVVGTDHAGSGHTGWYDNLSVALRLQSAALDFDPDLMRPLNLRSASFNQQYTAGSLIVEVGAAANSLREASLAGMIFAEAAARVINGGI